MEIGQCRLKLNKLGSDVPMTVTPAEVLVLREGFQANAGGDPIFDLKLVGTVERSAAGEVARLKSKYADLHIKGDAGQKVTVVDKVFAGHAPNVPQKFSEVGPMPPVGKFQKPKSYDPEPAVPEGGDIVAGLEEIGSEEIKPIAGVEENAPTVPVDVVTAPVEEPTPVPISNTEKSPTIVKKK